jgi:hypothetical protein
MQFEGEKVFDFIEQTQFWLRIGFAEKFILEASSF